MLSPLFPFRRLHFVFSLLLFGTHVEALAWVYPEHRNITLRAIRDLDPGQKAALERLWAFARTGWEPRLHVLPGDTTNPRKPATIDYAAWPAIAGDHSCSAQNMLQNILETDWILEVAAVTARLDADLAAAGVERHRRTNAMRDADLMLQRVDPEYAGRAGANSVHFLLARPGPETDQDTYVETCMANGCELNAIGAYGWHHVSALRKARRLAAGGLPDSTRNKLALSALADEAFAVHFLQDVFASGHVAGTRGDASLRKGTHDYYNEEGLEVHSWDGRSMILKGDAWMREEDLVRSARAVRTSFEQFLDAAGGRGPVTDFRFIETAGVTADTLNTCILESMPERTIEPGVGRLLTTILVTTPVPGLAEGEGELPRFRAEVGPFIGVVPAARAAMLFGGFGNAQDFSGAVGGLDVSVRLGLGLDGVMNESGDGLVFLDLGFRLDAASSSTLTSDDAFQTFGSLFAAIPSRSAFTTRVRMPFWLLPFDLLLAAPILLPADPEAYTRMAVVAGNGGLLPWQAGMATSFGRFQFVLGREVGVSLFGYFKKPDRLFIAYGEPGNEEAALVSLRSVQLEFPVVEYMPFRTFSMDQGTSLVIQLYGAVDIPSSVSDPFPQGSPLPDTQSVWQIGLRAAFRWRHYF